MAKLSINDFKSSLGGGVRSNLFQITSTKLGQEGGLLVKAASLPAIVLGEIETHHFGRINPIPGDRLFEEWTVQVYVDAKMEVYQKVLDWSNSLNNFTENTGDITDTEDLKVEQLNRKGEIIKTFTLNSAWPKNVAALEMDMETRDAIHIFSVTFRFCDFSQE